ncbi:MAG: response regulator, partial [Bacteroidota bacterium]
VINTGSIIPDEMVDKVFDRFYQLENLGMDNSKGTGIGLALAKGVVEAHKGDLSVNSTYADQTTLFRVKLKKGKEHYDEESIITSEETISPKMADHNGYTESSIESNPNGLGISNETILIVEDNQEVREFLNDLISPLFKTKIASNGAEAVEMVKESPPDLILSDVLMPQMKGTEMCAILKSDILTSHIPIILLTARGSDEHRIEGLETGADDYISKPFNTKILLARISNVLTNRKTIQNKFKENPTQFVKKVAKKRIDKEFMEKAQNAVLENIANSNYNVEAFSKDMTLGRTNLFLKIKGITGLTPNEFISGIRLGKAAQMILHQPEITVSDIAYACGFTSPSYFSRAFKAKYGVSPSDYNGQSTISNAESSTEAATA